MFPAWQAAERGAVVQAVKINPEITFFVCTGCLRIDEAFATFQRLVRHQLCGGGKRKYQKAYRDDEEKFDAAHVAYSFIETIDILIWISTSRSFIEKQRACQKSKSISASVIVAYFHELANK
jgi:hypothetical protein